MPYRDDIVYGRPLRLRLNALDFDLHIDHKLSFLHSEKTVEAEKSVNNSNFMNTYALNDFFFNTALKFFNKIYA